MRKKPWKSTTFYLTFWSVVILTIIVVRILGTSETMQPGAVAVLQTVAGLCGTIILAYVSGQKVIDYKHGPETEEKENEQCQR